MLQTFEFLSRTQGIHISTDFIQIFLKFDFNLEIHQRQELIGFCKIYTSEKLLPKHVGPGFLKSILYLKINNDSDFFLLILHTIGY